MNISSIFSLLPAYHKARFLLLLFLFIFSSILETLSLGLIIPFISILSNPSQFFSYLPWLEDAIPSTINEKGFLSVLIITMIVFFVVKTLFAVLIAIKQAHYVHSLEIKISNQLFQKYLYASYNYHTQTPSSQMIQFATVEASQFARGAVRTLLTIFAEAIMFLSIICFLIFYSPVEVMISISVIIALGVIYIWLIKNNVKQLGEVRQKFESRRIQAIQFGIEGFREIRVSGTQSYFKEQVTALNSKLFKVYSRVATLAAIPKLLLELCGASIVLLIILYSVLNSVELSTLLTKIAVFSAALFRMVPSVSRILVSFQNLRYSWAVIDKLKSELSAEEEVTDFKDKKPIEHFGFTKSVEVRNICFRYEKKQIVKNINLTIPQGKSVALIGPSGSGKTTILNILLGFLTPESGTIFIDDIKQNNLLDVWQKKVGYISQRVFLLNGTIADNIAFGTKQSIDTDEKIEHLFKLVGLDDATSNINVFTKVGERGENLSGGQAQRVALARALYNEPEILILDEFTSALDPKTEVNLMKVISRIPNITILLISHSQVIADACDIIYEISDGCCNRIKSA